MNTPSTCPNNDFGDALYEGRVHRKVIKVWSYYIFFVDRRHISVKKTAFWANKLNFLFRGSHFDFRKIETNINGIVDQFKNQFLDFAQGQVSRMLVAPHGGNF